MTRRNTTGASPFDFQGFDATTELLRGPVKPKRGPSEGGSRNGGQSSGGGAIASFIRSANLVSSKTPEAMVRITGAAKGAKHVKEHLAYISRNGKLEATNERGESITGREAVKELAAEWMVGSPKTAGTRRAPDTRNLMLSMPPGTDPEKVLRAAKTFADKTFGGERSFALVLHTDQKHPHVHLTVKTRGFDGANLHPRKADLQQWREDFAHELRELGVAAVATPRRARGVVKKPIKQAVHHMERDHKSGKKDRAPKAQIEKFQEAFREMTGREPPKVRPWEMKIAERQTKVRGAWLATAQVLEDQGTAEARKLAKQIRGFVADMPPVKTERQEIAAEVARQLERMRDRSAEQGRG